jgi:predicted TIM-barrel fold metal-dependent hydrolase
VTEAWAGSFDALLHKDLSAVNARLADECRASGGALVPFGAINPLLPDWEEDLRRCAEMHGMRGIRLHPNYHGYTLSDPSFAQILDAATAHKLIVQISVIMEDERTLHPLVNVPPTDTAPLAALLLRRPTARVQLLNAFRTLRGKPLVDLATAGARFEIAMLEGVEGITKLLAQIDVDRLCFGSHAPLFYFESAAFKLKESLLTESQLRAISVDNARRLLSAR